MNQIAEIKKWFELAVPEPTERNKCVQIGCHYEEVGEMFAASGDEHMSESLEEAAYEFKNVSDEEIAKNWASDFDERELLDALCDQIVTAVGVAHMFGFDIVGALAEVNRSNFSKFVDGKPVFNEHGKISKGKGYTPPNLEPFLGS